MEPDKRFRVMFEGTPTDHLTTDVRMSEINEGMGYDVADINAIDDLPVWGSYTAHDMTMTVCIWRLPND